MLSMCMPFFLIESRALSRRCHPSPAACQGMHGDAVKARPGRENFEDEMAVPLRVLTRRAVSALRIRFLHWLFSQCFRAPSLNTAEKEVRVNHRPPKSKVD